ncbi:MAG: tetratricopeptide repeat protein [Geobacter sp.]|nr:tetratricopeptide repeat protein [Geobacter sp.]
MEQMATLTAEQEFIRAELELAAENTIAALASLERGLKLFNAPQWHSHLGFCIAKERGQTRKGVDLCQNALTHEPDNSIHYLHLGRVHLLAGNKEEALRIFRQGIAKEGNEQIMQKLIELGMRKPLLFPSLERSHPLNRYLGWLLTRLGLR